jgi:hypothetical protein
MPNKGSKVKWCTIADKCSNLQICPRTCQQLCLVYDIVVYECFDGHNDGGGGG